MGFVDNIKDAFIKTFVYSGRASRAQAWHFSLFFMLVIFLFTASIFLFANLGLFDLIVVEQYLIIVVYIAFAITNISLSVRRCHDTNKSGWFCIIPIVGVYYIFFAKGTNGNNRFGDEPN